MRTLLFYSLLQIPGLAILGLLLTAAVHFAWLSPAVALGIGLAWLIKDIVMYPFVKSAYAPRDSDDRGPGGLVGATGTITRALAPAGFVRVKGELWQAECLQKESDLDSDFKNGADSDQESGRTKVRAGDGDAAFVPVDARVEIVATRGMVLLVRPLPEES